MLKTCYNTLFIQTYLYYSRQDYPLFGILHGALKNKGYISKYRHWQRHKLSSWVDFLCPQKAERWTEAILLKRANTTPYLF